MWFTKEFPKTKNQYQTDETLTMFNIPNPTLQQVFKKLKLTHQISPIVPYQKFL